MLYLPGTPVSAAPCLLQLYGTDALQMFTAVPHVSRLIAPRTATAQHNAAWSVALSGKQLLLLCLDSCLVLLSLCTASP